MLADTCPKLARTSAIIDPHEPTSVRISRIGPDRGFWSKSSTTLGLHFGDVPVTFRTTSELAGIAGNQFAGRVANNFSEAFEQLLSLDQYRPLQGPASITLGT